MADCSPALPIRARPRVGVISWISFPCLTPTKTSPVSSSPLVSMRIDAVGLKSTSTMIVPRIFCSAFRTTVANGTPNAPSTRRGGTARPPPRFSGRSFRAGKRRNQIRGPAGSDHLTTFVLDPDRDVIPDRRQRVRKERIGQGAELRGTHRLVRSPQEQKPNGRAAGEFERPLLMVLQCASRASPGGAWQPPQAV